MKKLKIISANVCGNPNSASNLSYPGNARIFDLTYRLASQENPDIIAIQEIPYKSLGLLQSSLAQYGYTMIIHENFQFERHKGRFICLTVLFIKKTIKFSQEYRDGFETQYRYVSGALNIDDEEQKIFIKANHVPPVCEEGGRGNGELTAAMLRRKVDFLKDELAYQQSMNDKYCISLGDYNTAAKGAYFGSEIFTQLPFIDLVGDELTWNNAAALDHIFVSKALAESGIPIQHRLIPSNLTDHKILKLEIGV